MPVLRNFWIDARMQIYCIDCSFGSMASVADSKPHFRQRASEYGIPDDLVTKLTGAGFDTLGRLAFAISRPGQEFEDSVFTDWVKTINGGAAPSLADTSALRRLHFEAEIILTASLKASIEQPQSEHATPKQLPFAERQARMQLLRDNFPGLLIENASEPSHQLIDTCCHQYESRVLQYIEPARCTSRETEILSGKLDKKLKLDSNTLTIKESKTSPDENINTTFDVMRCLKRRGIAYEFANLISYASHERYLESLFKHISTEPPPNFLHTSLSQIIKADQQVFLYMAANCKDIRPQPGGKRPLDDLLVSALQDYHTSFHLMPLPKVPAYGPTPSGWDDASQPYGSGKGKGKGKGKAKGQGSVVAPRGFVGCVGRDNKGRNICFDYNISGCSRAAPGAACKKGRHICFKANCFKVHSYKTAHGEEDKKPE